MINPEAARSLMATLPRNYAPTPVYTPNFLERWYSYVFPTSTAPPTSSPTLGNANATLPASTPALAQLVTPPVIQPQLTLPPSVVNQTAPVWSPTQGGQGLVGFMPSPTFYQSGLYRHMIWKLLQDDDPELMAQMHQTRTPLSPEELKDGIKFLLENERDALSAPQTANFLDNKARMTEVIDDLALWMKELSRRQRAKTPIASVVGATVGVVSRNPLLLVGLLLVVGGAGYLFMRRGAQGAPRLSAPYK
jgi:hypothetical protein